MRQRPERQSRWAAVVAVLCVAGALGALYIPLL
jgi:hypothetical protein